MEFLGEQGGTRPQPLQPASRSRSTKPPKPPKPEKAGPWCFAYSKKRTPVHSYKTVYFLEAFQPLGPSHIPSIPDLLFGWSCTSLGHWNVLNQLSEASEDTAPEEPKPVPSLALTLQVGRLTSWEILWSQGGGQVWDVFLGCCPLELLVFLLYKCIFNIVYIYIVVDSTL